jgi:hypothetical protein
MVVPVIGQINIEHPRRSVLFIASLRVLRCVSVHLGPIGQPFGDELPGQPCELFMEARLTHSTAGVGRARRVPATRGVSARRRSLADSRCLRALRQWAGFHWLRGGDAGDGPIGWGCRGVAG